jgi:hypothetical protein
MRIDNKRISPDFITELSQCEIFVFGSNIEGQHNGIAGRTAVERYGAIWGVGSGPMGRSYAIPTMHGNLQAIKPYVEQFIEYATAHRMKRFLLTRIGCGGGGFTDRQIAPLFSAALNIPNINIPKEWLPYMVPLDCAQEQEQAPDVISDSTFQLLCYLHRYKIGAGIQTDIPKVRVRYVRDKNEFGYTTLDNCFFFFHDEMYVWETDKRWEVDHNQDVVEGVFHDECKGRGYAHRTIFAGISTNVKDSNGEYMYTGDVIRIEIDGKTTELALDALEDGYGFRLGNSTLLLSNCQKHKLTRIGTVFYQLDLNEWPKQVFERVHEFNDINDSNKQHSDKVLMSKYTPNFDQEFWKYSGLETLGIEYNWNK